LVVLYNISTENNLEINDKLIVGLFFIIICLLGTSLAIKPGWIKRHLKIVLQISVKKNTKKPARKRKGHHPDCDRFKNHTIKINGRIYCAGCIGLAIGCLISIILMIIYVSFSFSLSSDFFLFLTILGFLIIGFVFVEIMINNRKTLIHIISNSLFVIGFLIIVISLIEITGDKIFGIISIIFSFLWLDTRIQLSNFNHSIICKNCNKTCKMY
jgi:uncharacterized membrane protein